MACAFFLSGCSLFKTPYALKLTEVDERGPQRPAVITISDPQVYARETLINDRRREVEFLKQLLEDSKDETFAPQLARDLRSITALRAELGLAFDPAKGRNAERKEELDALIFERDKLKLEQDLLVEQRRLEKMRTEGFDVQPRTGADATNSFDDNGAAPTAPTPDADRPDEFTINRGAAPDRSSMEQSPIDKFRDLQAYRAELRSALAAVNLDDLHDFGGNTLYRLQFDVMVAPGEKKNKFGVADLTVRAPKVDKEQVEALYLRWISAFTEQIYHDRAESAAREKENRSLRKSRINAFRDIAQSFGLELARPFKTDDEILVPSSPPSKTQLPAVVFVEGRNANINPQDPDARRCFEGELSQACFQFFSAAILAGEGGEDFLAFLSDLYQEIQKDPNKGAPYDAQGGSGLAQDEIPEALRSDSLLSETSQRIEFHNACGIPTTSRFNDAFSRSAQRWGIGSSDLEAMLEYPLLQADMHAFMEDIALSAINIRKSYFTFSAAIKNIEPDIKEPIARDFVDEINYRATLYLLLMIQLTPETKRKSCSDHIERQLFIVPDKFLDVVLADRANCNMYEDDCVLSGQSFAYGTTPVELAHRTSTISSAARSLEIAFAATASLAQAGASADFDTSFMRASSGNVEALERQPIVVGYSDRHAADMTAAVEAGQKFLPNFGWVFGPEARIDAKKNEITLEQVLRRHNVTADISAPAWWPAIVLEYGTAWAANWRKDKVIEQTRQREGEIVVGLPMNAADLDSLTTHLANAALPGSGVEMSETSISGVWPNTVSACTGEITFLIEGRNVWRSTAVYVGGVKARDITVLPDMKGIAATVDVGQLFSGWFSKFEPLRAHPKAKRKAPGASSDAAASEPQVPGAAEPPREVIYSLIDRYVKGDDKVDLVVWTRNGADKHEIELRGDDDGGDIDCFSKGYVTTPN